MIPPQNKIFVKVEDDIKVCVPNSLHLITPYVLLEQEDWFEDEMHFVRNFCQKGMTVLDIGANYGLYSLAMAKHVGEKGKVFSFEPSSTTVSYLAESISRNNIENILFVQAALSDSSGEAKLLLNDNSELNAIVDHTDNQHNYETVSLLTLDECAVKFAWNDVSFIKMDAEGQEPNIIKGGQKFFTNQSPLIMFELKHGDEVNVTLINDFLNYGYKTFRLIPGLNVLVPFDMNEQCDPFQLNLFCCKDDRVALLAQQGILVEPDILEKTEMSSGEIDLRGFLSQYPYAKQMEDVWFSSDIFEIMPGREDYLEAMHLYAYAHNGKNSGAMSYMALKKSLELLSASLDVYSSFPRLLTLARISWELGSRNLAVRALSILKEMYGRQQVEVFEPFLCPTPIFDEVDPGESFFEWCYSSILIQLEKLKSFSSYYSPESSLALVQEILKGTFYTVEMERRLGLIKMRLGQKDKDSHFDSLLEDSSDNKNADFWRKSVRH